MSPAGLIRIVVLCCVPLLIFQGLANAQHKARNSVYVGLASQGPVYALHFDRIYRDGEKLDYSLSAGFSIANNAVAFPVGLHFFTGTGNHHLEFALGLVPYIDYDHHLVGSNKSQTDTYLYVNPGMGYRFQPPAGGFFFKAIAGPSLILDPPSKDFWNMDPRWHGYGSVALGFSF